MRKGRFPLVCRGFSTGSVRPSKVLSFGRGFGALVLFFVSWKLEGDFGLHLL